MNPPDPANPDDKPGVPFFRSWRGVYWFVLGAFVAVVTLLAVFTHTYSG